MITSVWVSSVLVGGNAECHVQLLGESIDIGFGLKESDLEPFQHKIFLRIV
jgi:hypothetical protein